MPTPTHPIPPHDPSERYEYVGEERDKGKSQHVFTILLRFVEALRLARVSYEKANGRIEGLAERGPKLSSNKYLMAADQ